MFRVLHTQRLAAVLERALTSSLAQPALAASETKAEGTSLPVPSRVRPRRRRNLYAGAGVRSTWY